MQDKSTDACIGGIELIVSRIPDIRGNLGKSPLWGQMQKVSLDQTYLENSTVKMTLDLPQQYPNIKNKKVLLKDIEEL